MHLRVRAEHHSFGFHGLSLTGAQPATVDGGARGDVQATPNLATTECAARPCAGMPSIADDGGTVHENVRDSLRIAPWVIVGRRIDYRCRIEHDQVGESARADDTAVLESKLRRGHAGHPMDRFFHLEQSEIARVMPKHSWEASVEPGMRLAAH